MVCSASLGTSRNVARFPAVFTGAASSSSPARQGLVLWKTTTRPSTFKIMITLIAAGHYHQHSLLDTFAHSAMWRFGSIVVSDAARSAPFLIPIGLGLLAVALVRGLRRYRRG